jgi:uncharacterized protein with HEPN domain
LERDDGWLLDMLLYAREACGLVENVSREQFDADRKLQFALIHVVTVIGEAAAQVSRTRRAELPQIPWGQIVGTRNQLVHHYFKIDPNVLWEIAQVRAPELIQALEGVVPPP